MIIAAIVVLAGVVLALVFASLNDMPVLGSNALSLLNQAVDFMSPYLTAGIRFFNNFVYVGLIQRLLAITIAVELIIYGYKIIMWVATKIPMFGVSD